VATCAVARTTAAVTLRRNDLGTFAGEDLDGMPVSEGGAMNTTHGTRRLLRRVGIGALALAAAASLTLPMAAAAKPRWISGQMVRSTVTSCASIVAGVPVLTAGVLAEASFKADPKRLPKTGQVFYARVFIGGAGEPCVTQYAQLQVVLPLGVELAISSRRPVRCTHFTSTDSPIVPLTRADGCPRRASRGTYGVQFDRTTRADGLWELPRGQGYFVDFPLRSSRKLKGIAAGQPLCGRVEDAPPCSRKEVRDNLQAAIFVIDGDTDPWVAPHVGLFVRR
jgi:hypothetical protein